MENNEKNMGDHENKALKDTGIVPNTLQAIRKKIRIPEVLNKTITVYKSGFKQFIGLSAVTLTYVACQTLMEVAGGYSAILLLPTLALLIVSFYLMLRVNVSLYLLSKELVQGLRPSFKEAFQSSKGHCGTYFAVMLKLLLITILPLIGIVISFMAVNNILLKCILVGICAIPFAFLYARYYLAIPSALLAENQYSEFDSSKQLVKGDFWSVLTVIVLTYGIYMLIMQIIGWAAVSEGLALATLIGLVLLQCTVMIFFIPFGSIAAVVMYLELNEIKGIDQLTVTPLKDGLSEEKNENKETDINEQKSEEMNNSADI